MQVLCDLNLENNQILNAIVHKVSADPAKETKNTAMLVYNTTEKKIKFYNGTEWITIGTGDGSTITIEIELSDTSTNDKAAGAKAVVDYVKKAIGSTISKITNIEKGQVIRKNPSSGELEGIAIDSEVTKNSNNLVSSGAVFKFFDDNVSIHKIIEGCPYLTSTNNKIVWTISLEHSTKAFVQIYEASTNEMVFADIKDTTNSIEITLNGINGNIAKNSYYAVIIY